MTTIRQLFGIFAIAGCTATTAGAASVYLVPILPYTFQPPGTTLVPVLQSLAAVSFDLMMNFSASELTVGGGIDIDVSGPGTFGSFTPSTYFSTTPDPAFTGHGTVRADNEYEIHLGSFSGLSGINNLGVLTFNSSGLGIVTIALAPNQFFGGFYSATTALPMDVQMTGATLVPVPEPQIALLLLAGLGVVGIAGRRRLPQR